MTPILITWKDATSVDEWVDLEEAAKLGLHTVHTIGWLVSQDLEKYVVAGNWDVDRPGIAQHIAIPKVCVASVCIFPDVLATL